MMWGQIRIKFELFNDCIHAYLGYCVRQTMDISGVVYRVV
jgi:hypothetical protein